MYSSDVKPSLVPRPSSKEERGSGKYQYILTLWASSCHGKAKPLKLLAGLQQIGGVLSKSVMCEE